MIRWVGRPRLAASMLCATNVQLRQLSVLGRVGLRHQSTFAQGQLSPSLLDEIARSPTAEGLIDVQKVIAGLANLQSKQLSYDEFVEGQALADELLILLKQANSSEGKIFINASQVLALIKTGVQFEFTDAWFWNFVNKKLETTSNKMTPSDLIDSLTLLNNAKQLSIITLRSGLINLTNFCANGSLSAQELALFLLIVQSQ